MRDDRNSRLIGRSAAWSSSAAPAGGAQAPLLQGSLTWADLLAYESWAEDWRRSYHPEAAAVAAIAAGDEAVVLWAFVATWCGDCRRELPRLYAILHEAGWPPERLRLIGVDRSKRDPAGASDDWKVTRVPTLIAEREGVELGRIVERPDGALEAHLARILQR